MEDFRQFFKGVKDPRRSNATRHDFLEMLTVALLSSLCGGQTCVDMADFAVLNEKFLRRFMRLEHGPPSHDAFSRLFRMMDPGPFAAALSRFASGWAKALEADGVRQIAVDGKALRRTFSRASELSPLHLLSAFAPGSGIVLGQVAVDKKSNEIRALPALLEMLSLEGTLVTADALHTQRAASELIIGKGGNYVLTLKANQKELHKDAKKWLEDPEAQKEMLSYQHVGCGHGRIETRTATVSHDVGWLQDLHRWPGLEAVGKVEAARETEGQTKTETRYCIMSRKMSSEELLKAVRNHWAIENSLHWVLDVQMGEDDLRNRMGHGPENLAAVRKIAPDIIRLMDDKLSIRRRFRWAAQMPEYRLKLIRRAAVLAPEF